MLVCRSAATFVLAYSTITTVDCVVDKNENCILHYDLKYKHLNWIIISYNSADVYKKAIKQATFPFKLFFSSVFFHHTEY